MSPTNQARTFQVNLDYRHAWDKTRALVSGLTAKFARNSTSPEPMAGFVYDVTYVIELRHSRGPLRAVDALGVWDAARHGTADINPDAVRFSVPGGMTVRVPESLTAAPDAMVWMRQKGRKQRSRRRDQRVHPHGPAAATTTRVTGRPRRFGCRVCMWWRRCRKARPWSPRPSGRSRPRCPPPSRRPNATVRCFGG